MALQALIDLVLLFHVVALLVVLQCVLLFHVIVEILIVLVCYFSDFLLHYQLKIKVQFVFSKNLGFCFYHEGLTKYDPVVSVVAEAGRGKTEHVLFLRSSWS